MDDKLNFLKQKLEEVLNVNKSNVSAFKEVSENIKIAQDHREKLNENILKVQGVIEGLQFAIGQLEQSSNRILNTGGNQKAIGPEADISKKKGK